MLAASNSAGRALFKAKGIAFGKCESEQDFEGIRQAT